MGIFYPFVNDRVRLIGVEAGGGKGLETGLHAASLNAGELGVFHACSATSSRTRRAR